MNAYQEFVYNADQHDTSAKTFSFPIYSNGSRTIPARSESAGMQDGIDLITALAMHPETARRLARKFWNFFVSEIHAPDPAFVESTAAVYLQSGTEIRPVVRYILTLAVVHQSVDALRALFMAGGIRRAGDQGSGLAELLARQGRVAAGHHGHAALRAAERRRMAARRRLVLDGDDAGAQRISRPRWRPARRSSSPRRWRPTAQTAAGLLAAMLERVTPAPFDSGPQQALMSYLRRRRGVDRQRASNSTPGPPAWRACSSAPPSTSSFRRERPCTYLDDSSSATASPPSRSGSPRRRS